jgi:hypothetical protein
MRERLILAAVLLVVCLCVVNAAVAAPPSPATYHNKVESVCRVNNVLMTRFDKQKRSALAARDLPGYYTALGRMLGVTLIQDRELETTPVPLSLRAKMTAVMIDLRRIDKIVSRTIQLARTGNTAATLAELNTVAPVTKRVESRLKAAGLPNCAAMYS